MLKQKLFLLLIFLVNFQGISYSNDILSIEYNNKEIKLSFPNNYCDITKNFDGIFLKNYLDEQYTSGIGPEAKVIFKLCNSIDSYPWGYVGLVPHENNIFMSQTSYNKLIKKTLGNEKLFDKLIDSVEEHHENLLSSDYGVSSELNFGTKPGVVWEDEDVIVIKVVNEGFIENEKFIEVTIGSITVLKDSIITYYIIDNINSSGKLDEETDKKLTEVIEKFKKNK